MVAGTRPQLSGDSESVSLAPRLGAFKHQLNNDSAKIAAQLTLKSLLDQRLTSARGSVNRTITNSSPR
jgi:hypothetical protein